MPKPAEEADHPMVVRVPIGTAIADLERLVIMKTLEASGGNKQRAARILGISRRGLYMKLISFGQHVALPQGENP
jgi:DNA-binding NtrC family response regulator